MKFKINYILLFEKLILSQSLLNLIKSSKSILQEKTGFIIVLEF